MKKGLGGDHRTGGADAASGGGKTGDSAAGRERQHIEFAAVALDKVECRLSDRSRRPQYGDGALHPVHNPPTRIRNVARTTGSRPSSRSSAPPCPGRLVPLSLPPARRFSPRSQRSPASAVRAL